MFRGMDLYQVLLEVGDHHYLFDVATPDYDAVELAKIWLLEHRGIDTGKVPVHVGGYSMVGQADKSSVELIHES